MSSKRLAIFLICSTIAISVVFVVAFFGQAPYVASTLPAATTQSTAVVAPPPPATKPGDAAIVTYGDLLHAELKHYPTTKPWPIGVDLSYAAHVILRDPVYVCPRGDLWIIRPDADPLPKVLARAGKETEHVTSGKITYIIWTTNRKNESVAYAVSPVAGGYELISATEHNALPAKRDYLWDRAGTWDDNGTLRVIVPTPQGVSVLTIAKTITEQYQPLVDDSSRTNPIPQVLFDLRGILAWIPADGDFHGPSSAARFVNGKWTLFDSDDWKHAIVHLIPMLDGSVLQIRRGDTDVVDLTILPLDAATVDHDEIAKLVTQLADDDPDKRQAAFDRLTEFGPGIFPILRQLQPDALPEAQGKINELTHGKLEAKLGGMEINDNRLTVSSRLPDGGVILFAPAGVTIPRDGDEPRVVEPDYIVIRPGHAVQELPEELVKLLTPGAVISSIHDEWIINTDTDGPQRYLPPDKLDPLLRKGEEKYSQVTAIDSHDRWLLQNSHASATQPSGSLLLDPTVPDPSPRLSLWLIDNGTQAGWNTAGWPVIKKAKDLWAITSTGWELMPKDQKLLTDPPAPQPPTTLPTTAPAIASTEPTDDASPILTYTANGNRYQDGKTSLIVTTPNRIKTTWPLPNTSAGTSDDRAWLVEANDGALFLVNDSDRITRLRPTPDEAEPFTVEAIFTSQLPHFSDIVRVWRDPAGRIDVVYHDHELAIIFPTGQVPPDISAKILAQDLRLSEPE